ncbi:MAG: hypothetical protein AM325_006715 [Candidatus Thorarchaeota archaeon SMTZ1-45]|nr:MAG: hypothetical protein AM325_08465 [Candidatus Thorarchaeota archaeon SMTZ1-45]
MVFLIILGSFVLFYHGVDQVMRLGFTHTLILSGEEGTADFTAASDLPIYISGYHTFDIVGEEVDFTVTLYDSEGAYLAHLDVYLNSPGTLVETLSYHETIDYTLTPGEQYSIEVIGQNFNGNIEQPHTPVAQFVLHAFYAGELIGLVFLVMAVFWICMLVGLGAAGVDEVKKRRTQKVIQ